MMKPTILIFDSGMGGISVYDEIRIAFPFAHYLYCFDNAFFPYSEKEPEAITERVVQIVQKINEIHPLNLVVIACNTASTVVLPSLRSAFSFPVVGTVPAIKPAAQLSKSKVIGLLATKGTVTRSYVAELIENYAANCQVEKIGTTELVEIAEAKLQGKTVSLNKIEEIVAKWRQNTVLDTVVLGCTHFPLIKTELQMCLPNVCFFVDSGKAIAQRVESLLNSEQKKSAKLLEDEISYKKNQAFCTKMTNHAEIQTSIMQNRGFSQLTLLVL